MSFVISFFLLNFNIFVILNNFEFIFLIFKNVFMYKGKNVLFVINNIFDVLLKLNYNMKSGVIVRWGIVFNICIDGFKYCLFFVENLIIVFKMIFKFLLIKKLVVVLNILIFKWLNNFFVLISFWKVKKIFNGVGKIVLEIRLNMLVNC